MKQDHHPLELEEKVMEPNPLKQEVKKVNQQHLEKLEKEVNQHLEMVRNIQGSLVMELLAKKL